MAEHPAILEALRPYRLRIASRIGCTKDQTKAPLYARYAIPELWIVDLHHDRVTQYRDPTATGYTTTQVFRRGESLSPLAFPGLRIPVDDMLG